MDPIQSPASMHGDEFANPPRGDLAPVPALLQPSWDNLNAIERHWVGTIVRLPAAHSRYPIAMAAAIAAIVEGRPKGWMSLPLLAQSSLCQVMRAAA